MWVRLGWFRGTDCQMPAPPASSWARSNEKHFSRSVQSLSAALQASLSITNSWNLPRLMSIELVMPSNHLILCHPLLFPSIFPSIRVFSNELVFHIRWPKYWSFSFSISPSNEHPGLLSFRMDWLDLLAVQGTLKSLLQHQKRLNNCKFTQLLRDSTSPTPDAWNSKQCLPYTDLAPDDFISKCSIYLILLHL